MLSAGGFVSPLSHTDCSHPSRGASIHVGLAKLIRVATVFRLAVHDARQMRSKET